MGGGPARSMTLCLLAVGRRLALALDAAARGVAGREFAAGDGVPVANVDASLVAEEVAILMAKGSDFAIGLGFVQDGEFDIKTL